MLDHTRHCELSTLTLVPSIDMTSPLHLPGVPLPCSTFFQKVKSALGYTIVSLIFIGLVIGILYGELRGAGSQQHMVGSSLAATGR
jgi:hypothetical protein